MPLIATSAVFDLTNQLTTSSINIIATCASDRGVKAAVHQDIAEAHDGIHIGALVVGVGKWVEGNKIHFGLHPIQNANELFGMLWCVVQTCQHHVFHGDGAPWLILKVSSADSH